MWKRLPAQSSISATPTSMMIQSTWRGGRSRRLRTNSASHVVRYVWVRPVTGDSSILKGLWNRQMLSILNKLTPENFDKLLKKILDISITNGETLQAVIKLLFEKAISESQFCVMYAELCAQ